MRLKDRVAVITGGGRGIGRATALKFAGEGAIVALVDRDLPELEAVAAEITAAGGRASVHQADIASRESIDKMVAEVVAAHSTIDVLVNNAGIIRDKQLLKMETADFDAVIDVNLKGVYHCTQACAAVMVEHKKGVILNAASVVALYGNFGQTNYVAAKAGVIGMTKVWARELGRKGIRVNAVAPGFIETRMTEGIPEKVIDMIVERVPLQRMGRPEEIANAYLFLASDEASYISGHVLSVDGGAVT
jgi:3-oxoacyl-[acyl-carrier protein] reductase